MEVWSWQFWLFAAVVVGPWIGFAIAIWVIEHDYQKIKRRIDDGR